MFLFVVPSAFGGYVPLCFILGRALPFGTVGGRIGTARKPSASRMRAAASASSASPTTTGTIGLAASGRPAAPEEGDFKN